MRALPRLALLLALAAPPLAHAGCVREIAYQVRLEQAARAHVYAVPHAKLLAAAKKAAEAEGWELDAPPGKDFGGKAREKNGRKERLLVALVKDGEGHRLEADLEVETKTKDGVQTSTAHAGSLEVAVFQELEPKAAEAAKAKAQAQAKEDAKAARACGRRLVDLATGADDP